MLCNDFLNSLEEKITAYYGTIYLISFTFLFVVCFLFKIKLYKQNKVKRNLGFYLDFFH